MGQVRFLSEHNQHFPDADPGSRCPTASQFLAVGERLRMTPEFGRRFIIFADAEEEFDWSAPFDRKSNATNTIADLVPATARFNAAGVRPVYLCDFPVVNVPQSAAIMRDMVTSGACDVGTQLHPWVNPPFEEAVCPYNSYTGNLPVALQRAKLIALTDKIEERIGVRPTSYRAGRYGIGPATMQLLAEQGYQLDVSVRATFNYNTQNGPDFSSFPVWPWKTAEGPFELPLSTAWTGVLRRFPGLYRSEVGRGVLARTGLLSRVPLTPEGVPLADALDAIQTLFDDGLEIFSLSFHTPSVAIGHTPYVRNADDLRTFWLWWDGVFNLFAKLGVAPVAYDALLAALRKS